MRIRWTAAILVAALWFAPSAAQAVPGGCEASGTPRLCAVHVWVGRTHVEQARRGLSLTRYGWAAERTHSLAYRSWIARQWFLRWRHVRSLPINVVPAWFVAKARCLARAEEFGFPGDAKGGQNTTAGYFGMVSPPYQYPGGEGMGSSWLALSLSQQLWIVWSEWRALGSAPWPNTAPGCGL